MTEPERLDGSRRRSITPLPPDPPEARDTDGARPMENTPPPGSEEEPGVAKPPAGESVSGGDGQPAGGEES